MCGWHLHAFNTWEVSLSNLTVISGLWRWHTPWKDEITTSLNDLPHEYGIKFSHQMPFVALKLSAYWWSFGPFLPPAPFSLCYNVLTLPPWMGRQRLVPLSFPAGQSVGLSHLRSRELVHRATLNLCNTWKAALGTRSQIIVQKSELTPPPRAKGFRLVAIASRKVSHLIGQKQKEPSS